LFSDVADFGSPSRNDEDRRIIREALFSMTYAILKSLPDVWSWDDRGDGQLTVIPSVPTVNIVKLLHAELPIALDEHNHAYHAAAQIRLRVAIHVGPVATDSLGVSSEAIIKTSRMVEAPRLKKAMRSSKACLGIIASPYIYDTVIKHNRELTGYSKIQVRVKETDMSAWVKLFGLELQSPDI